MSAFKHLQRFRSWLFRLTSREFESFVLDLLKASGNFDETKIFHSHVEYGYDILAFQNTAGGRVKWYVEVKRVEVISSDVINHLIGIWDKIGRAPDTRLLLVSPGNLTKSALELAAKSGLIIWDIYDLYDLTTLEIEQKYFSFEAVDESTSSETESKEKELIALLQEIKPGRQDWVKFQKISSDILEHLFCPPLESPRYEMIDLEARNRRDMIFENSSQDEFWTLIREIYQGYYIVVDAKNYKKPLNKKPVIELAHYLKPYGCGMFGMLTSRNGANEAARHAVREQWIGNHKMIITLSDSELIEMLKIKEIGGEPAEIIRKKIADFRMSL